ncbi:MAG TPA: T9SS type A sorting domain-containing protein [Flavobacteriales bacterium]|nr:T9SS type A sorting domain-containing protein [Flavobacteriales bacterium]
MIKLLPVFAMSVIASHCFAQPSNDEPTTASTLVSGVPFTLHFNGATPSTDAAAWNGGTGGDIFVKFTVPGEAFTLVYDQSTFTGTLYESTWIDHVSDTTQVSAGSSCCGGSMSAIGSGGLNPGTTYYMGFYVDPGDDTLMTITLLLPPSNDNYITSPMLSVGISCTTTSGTLLGATESLYGFPTCYGIADDDVWYTFIATDTQATVRAVGMSDLVIEVYENAFGFPMLDCGSQTTSGVDSVVIGSLTPGEMYYLRIFDSDFWFAPFSSGIDLTFDICVYAAYANAIAENKEKNISLSVYPNPARETVHVVYADNEIQLTNIEIVNMSGQVVMSQPVQQSTNSIHREIIDIQTLPPGIYAVKLIATDKQVFRPLVKN